MNNELSNLQGIGIVGWIGSIGTAAWGWRDLAMGQFNTNPNK